MPDGASKVGAAYVEIMANTDAVGPALEQVRSDTEKTARSFQGLDKTVKENTRSITQYTKSFTALAGAAGAIISVAQTAVTAWEYANQVFGNGAKKAEEFLASLSNSSTNASVSLEQLREKIASVEAELARNQEKPFFDLRGRSTRTITQELDRLRTAEASLSVQSRAQANARIEAEEKVRKKKAETESVEKSRQQAERDSTDRRAQYLDALQAEVDLLSGEERIVQQTAVDILKLLDVREKLNDAQAKSFLDRRIEAELAKRNLNIERFRADEAERAADAHERSAKAAKEFADSIARARIESIQFQDRQQAGFGIGDLQASVNDIAAALNAIRGQIR